MTFQTRVWCFEKRRCRLFVKALADIYINRLYVNPHLAEIPKGDGRYLEGKTEKDGRREPPSSPLSLKPLPRSRATAELHEAI